jgi:hypothetical protein
MKIKLTLITLALLPVALGTATPARAYGEVGSFNAQAHCGVVSPAGISLSVSASASRALPSQWVSAHFYIQHVAGGPGIWTDWLPMRLHTWRDTSTPG